tara:strand:- start:4290 stop:4745 length:456 start_codon:yes stop_codon:yes gene_type:complete
MDIKTYESLITAFRTDGDHQAKQKRIEYTESRGDEDVLANFKSTAKSLDLKTLDVLGIFMQKHFSSILNYIKSGKTFSDESISSRIMDLIQYLELTYACVTEERQNDDSFTIEDRLIDSTPTSDLPEDRLLQPEVINKDSIRQGIQNDMEC